MVALDGWADPGRLWTDLSARCSCGRSAAEVGRSLGRTVAVPVAADRPVASCRRRESVTSPPGPASGHAATGPTPLTRGHGAATGERTVTAPNHTGTAPDRTVTAPDHAVTTR